MQIHFEEKNNLKFFDLRPLNFLSRHYHHLFFSRTSASSCAVPMGAARELIGIFFPPMSAFCICILHVCVGRLRTTCRLHRFSSAFCICIGTEKLPLWRGGDSFFSFIRTNLWVEASARRVIEGRTAILSSPDTSGDPRAHNLIYSDCHTLALVFPDGSHPTSTQMKGTCREYLLAILWDVRANIQNISTTK